MPKRNNWSLQFFWPFHFPRKARVTCTSNLRGEYTSYTKIKYLVLALTVAQDTANSRESYLIRLLALNFTSSSWHGAKVSVKSTNSTRFKAFIRYRATSIGTEDRVTQVEYLKWQKSLAGTCSTFSLFPVRAQAWTREHWWHFCTLFYSLCTHILCYHPSI